ncbi:MAG: nickel pincer cofactor biosynthesis protein LarB [Methanomicrobia archaeon]|nr:nickel pincer cofactor biosynthesis protein LarB [Methanomicrobia archaeon]
MEELLKKVARGDLSIEEASKHLKSQQLEQLKDFARIDLGRAQRTGIPEIIFAEGKSSSGVADIAMAHATAKGFALISRAREEDVKALKKRLNDDKDFEVDHNPVARTILLKQRGHSFEKHGKIGIIAAGTADIPVAEEARVVADVCGCDVITAYDVGIAGIHRLAAPLEELVKEEVVALIVVAGMEGALPSVVAGLVDVPVIGVPTSLGYGLGGEGVAALFSMLQSCAPGLAVVNIDNGVGAGTFAAKCVRTHAQQLTTQERQTDVNP